MCQTRSKSSAVPSGAARSQRRLTGLAAGLLALFAGAAAAQPALEITDPTQGTRDPLSQVRGGRGYTCTATDRTLQSMFAANQLMAAYEAQGQAYMNRVNQRRSSALGEKANELGKSPYPANPGLKAGANKSFVDLTTGWRPIRPVPFGVDLDGDGFPDQVDDPFPQNPTIVYYSFLNTAHTDVLWVDGIDDANLLGVLDDMGMPLDTDLIAEGWPGVPGRIPVFDIIPPPLLEDNGPETAPTQQVLAALGLSGAIWGQDRPFFASPDGEAVFYLAKTGIFGGLVPNFRATAPAELVVTGRQQQLYFVAMEIIERSCNVVFLQRDAGGTLDFPFNPVGDPFNPAASLIGVEGEEAGDPSDDYPWLLLCDSSGTGLGNFTTALGLARTPFDLDYIHDDLNEDGFPDVIFGAGVGAVTYFPVSGLPTGNFPVDVTLANVDGPAFSAGPTLPGPLDLIIANGLESSISIYANLADFDAPLLQQTIPVPPPSQVIGAEFNPAGSAPGLEPDDLFGDLLVVSEATDSVTVLLWDDPTPTTGTDPDLPGGLVSTGQVAVGDQPVDAVVADFNGDGLPDIATANQAGGSITVLFNDGDGDGQTGVAEPPFDDAGPIADLTIATGTPAGIVATDIDGDLDTDLVVTNFGANTITAFQNNGAGAFAALGAVAVGTGPTRLEAADLTGDGLNDLIVINQTAGSITTLRATAGTGVFVAVSTLVRPAPTFVNPSDVVVGDFVGDEANRPDFAVSFTGTNNIEIYFSVGDGTFTSNSILATNASAPRLAVGNPFDTAAPTNPGIIAPISPFDTVTTFEAIPANVVRPSTVDLSLGPLPGDGFSDLTDLDGDSINDDILINGVRHIDTNLDGLPDSADRDLDGEPDDRNGVDADGDGVFDDLNGDNVFDGDGNPDFGPLVPDPTGVFGYMEPIPCAPVLVDFGAADDDLAVVIAVHELMHALGFFHEHQRPDRDQFVRINFENVALGAVTQFTRVPVVPDPGFLSPEYDFLSVMHYGQFFGTNGRGPTIETVFPFNSFQDEIGNIRDLSAIDIETLQSIFGPNPSGESEWFYGRDQACPVDVNRNGFQGVDDLLLYIQIWQTGDLTADIFPSPVFDAIGTPDPEPPFDDEQFPDGIVDIQDLIFFYQELVRTGIGPCGDTTPEEFRRNLLEGNTQSGT